MPRRLLKILCFVVIGIAGLATNFEGQSAVAAIVQDKAPPPTDEIVNQGKSNENPPDSESPTETKTEEPKIAAEKAPLEELVTLGSLSADGRHRFLATFTTSGAGLVRLELNARDSRGNYAYRDLEHFGGYIGKLDLIEVTEGLRVGSAGEGTPAALAGLKTGDIITKFNDQPIVSLMDFDRLLQRTKSGETVTINYVRENDGNKSNQTTQVALTDQPLELLSREVDFVDIGVASPPSFLLQLRAIVSDNEWKAIDPAMKSARWKAEKTKIDGRETLDFTYEISADIAQANGLTGPITVIKRFSLPTLDSAAASELNSRTFDLKFELIVRGPAGSPTFDLGVQLDGPTGATTEGWWYQNKIHGRSTALFYIAGARDVISSTVASSFNFKGCPEIVDRTIKSSNVQYIIERPDLQGAETPRNELRYLSVDAQYFNISLLPSQSETNSEKPYYCYSALAYVASSPFKKANAKYARKVDCSFILFDRIQVPGGGEYRQAFDIFAGPKKTALLEKYGLENTRVFGWFSWFSQILCWLLTGLYYVTFKTSYGLAIILLTVLVRLAILPLSRKAAKNAQMMQLLAPELKLITEKYKDDLEKRGQAQRDLFRRHNYNPMAGCLPAFLQIPVLIGLYKGLSVDIALRDQPLIPGLDWCSNLAAPDKLFYWKDYLWSALGSETGWLGPYFNILPLITIVLFLIQQKMFTPPPTDEQQAITQKMMTYMMFFMGIMFFKVPAGLCIYFITSSFWGIMERKLLPKPKLSEDKINEIRANASISALEPAVRKSAPSKSDKGKPATPTPGTGGFMDRIREAIDAAQKKNSTIVNQDKEKSDKERRKRLRDR
ncbi:MAG: YidC/Oxa1 family insertase periplasmic-domain containing protein [Pirellulaceae bacterium]